MDAHDRRPPDPLGVLSHYSHVVWYTGDDYVPREPDAPGGSGITKRAVETQNNVRDFINDGGKLFFTGNNAGRVFAEGYAYNPFQDEEHTYCQDENPSCIIVQDDFLQYYLGAYRYVGGAGQDPADDSIFPVEGTTGPFDPLSLTFNGPDSAQNGDFASTLLVTSSVLDPSTYPLYADSAAAAEWIRPFASPFDPHDGDWFLSAGATDAAYKRLLKPFSVPAGGGNVQVLDVVRPGARLRLHLRRDPHRRRGRLDDAGGRERQHLGRRRALLPVGEPGSDWQSNHPFLAHYQTKTDNGNDCDPTGTSGSWNAATGNSGGWQDWSLPIPAAYHGQNVEISVSVVSDPATSGPRHLGRRAPPRGQRRRADQLGRPVVRVGHGRLDHARPAPARGPRRPVDGDRLGAGAERTVRGDADHDHRRHRLHRLRA